MAQRRAKPRSRVPDEMQPRYQKQTDLPNRVLGLSAALGAGIGGSSSRRDIPPSALWRPRLSSEPPLGFFSENPAHQIVRSALECRILRSAVTSESPSTKAVAPIIRSAGSRG